MSRKRAVLLGILALTLVVLSWPHGSETDPVLSQVVPDHTEPCGGEKPPKPGGATFTCAFSDDFDGQEIDATKWMPNKTTYAGVTSEAADCFVDDPDNISVSDGMLHLTSRVEPAPFVCAGPLGDFTTSTTAATVMTRNRFAQSYGRFEIRARFPPTTAAGVHSALWLYPQTTSYGPWPNSGEIDIAEWYSSVPEHVFPSVHYAGEVRPASTGHTCVVASPESSFHQYAVEWTPTLMRFIYDGEQCWEYTWTPTAPLIAPQPFDQPFFVLLTQVYGGGSNAPTAASPPVATMDVDWVRVWK